MAPLHAHGRLPRAARCRSSSAATAATSRTPRASLPRCARRPLLGQHRLRLRRGDRPGRARADARAALLHELVVRAPARDRARADGRRPRSGRPQPRLLRLGRFGGGRVCLEARASALPRAGRQARQVQGDRAPDRVPRHHLRRALDQRDRGAARAVRAARPRGAARQQHEPLPPASRGVRGGVHAVPAGRARADDRRDGPGDRVPRAHGARAERGRRVHAACRLLAGRSRALRPLRHPAERRRGDHRLRTGRRVVRLCALRHQAGPGLLREGPLVVVRRDRRRDRTRHGHGAVHAGRLGVHARDHLRRTSRHVARSRSRTSRS